MADELATVAEVVPSFCEGELLSGVLTDACIAATSATAYTIRSAVLWNTRELALLGRQLTALQAQAQAQDGGSRAKKVRKGTSNNSSSSQEGTVDEDMENHSSAPSKAEAKLERSISMAVDGVIALREKLLDVLQAWISAEVPPQSDSQSGGASSQSSGSLSSSSARLVRALQIEAFDQVNFLRTVFPVRETQYKYIDRLAFTPTQAMLGGLQKVFEAEGSRVRTELMSCSQGEAQNDAAINRLSHKLISSLFDPLSCNLLNDVEHLNRKQAAAVIYYLLDANQVIEDNIKSFMRNLKERNLVKYLEIQLVALKGLFQSGVTKPTQARIAADEAEDDDFDRAENDALIAEGYHRLETLARKLGHSLGVGKCKDDGLVGLENFFKAAIDYALSDEFNVGFAGCLCHYTRFLPPQSQRDISEHFLSVLDAHPAIANEMVDQRARDTDADFYRNTEGFSRLLDFADAIQGRARPKMTRRKSSTGSYAVNRSAELSRMDDVPARTGAKQAAPKTAPASKQRKNVPQQQMRLAVSSQVLADEDLALIHGGRYDEEQSSARNGKKAKVGPVAKVAAARGMKSATAPMKSAVPPNNSRQSARSSARSVGSKSYAEADSSEGEQEEDDDEEGEEDEEEVGEEGMGAGEEEEESEVEDIDEDDYSGLSGAASKRGYQQPFRHQTQTQTQTQIQRQTQAKAQTKTKAKTQSKAQWAAGTNQRSQASTTFGGIVLGLDIEDVDDADINMDLVGEGDEEEDDIEDVSGASSSRSGLGRSGSGNQQGGNPKKRSLGQSGMGMGMGGGSVAADSFAELDSIPSRRRLRA